MAGQAKAKAKRATRRKRTPKSVGLEPKDCSIDITGEVASVAEKVDAVGGCVLAAYRDPGVLHLMVAGTLGGLLGFGAPVPA